MLFNSIDFLIYFPIVTIVFFTLPNKLRNIFLLAASLYFYMCWKAKYIVLIGFTIIVTYLGGLLITHFRDKSNNQKAAKCVLILTLASNLGVLFIFKYYNFFADSLNAITGISLPFFRFALPVGISFYTFQAIGYIIDVYRNNIKADKNIITYALFISFYPQLVAGPIERSKNLLQQIKAPKRFNYENMRSGLLLMGYGFFQKLVIADRLALFVNNTYSQYQSIDGAYLLLATVMFALQIYCDFASYSNIAIGAARVMGYNLMTNFKAPYFSKSISDFWRRWHISLSGWFMDYVYIPLGGSRKGKARTYVNLLITFLISGLWHGAAITFVIWGTIHAIYRILEIALQKPKERLYKKLKINTKSKLFGFIQTIFTFTLVCFTYIFFRAETISQALMIIFKITSDIHISTLFTQKLFTYGIDLPDFVVLVIALIVLYIADLTVYKGIDIYTFITNKNRLIRWLIYWIIIFSTLIFGIYGPSYDSSPFIYFQF